MTITKKSTKKVAKLSASSRFVKLDDAGNPLPAEATEFSQIHDTETDLIWTAKTLGQAVDWKTANAVAKDCRIGENITWTLPCIRKLLSIVDYDEFRPAVDPEAFPDTKPSWYWSSSVGASAPRAFAWGVVFYYGSSYWYNQGYTGFVRAVRSASASQ